MPVALAGTPRSTAMPARHTPPFLLVSALLSFPAASEADSRLELAQVRRLAEGSVLSTAAEASAPGALPAWVLTAPRALLGAAATVAPPAAALPPGDIHTTVAGLSRRLAALAPTGEVDAFGPDMRLGPSVAVRGVHVYEVDDSLLKAFTLDTVVGPEEWVVVNLRGEIGRESLRERRAVPRPEPQPLTAEGMLLLSRHPRSA